MFNTTVTLFNYDQKNDICYPTLLQKVELQPKYNTKFSSNSTEDKDLALLIVKYYIGTNGKTPYLSQKSYKTQKLWNKLSGEDKNNYFTFNTGLDFFVKGDYSSMLDVEYETFKNQNDEVFFIHYGKDFEDDLKHWEIEGY